MKVADQSSNCV